MKIEIQASGENVTDLATLLRELADHFDNKHNLQAWLLVDKSRARYVSAVVVKEED